MKKLLNPLVLTIATIILCAPAFLYNLVLAPIFGWADSEFPTWVWICLYAAIIPFGTLIITRFIIPIIYWISRVFKKK